MINFHNAKLKWKIVLWASALIMTLFFTYNVLQYFVMSAWMVHHEELAIQDKMIEIQHYYQKENHIGISATQLEEDREYLQSILEKSETIIVFDKNENPIIKIGQNASKWSSKSPIKSSDIVLRHGGDNRLLIVKKKITNPHFNGTIEIIRNLESFDSLLDEFAVVMLITVIGAIAVSVFGGLFLSKKLLKPLQDISTTLTRIKKYGLEERVAVKENRDEISQLALHFNELMDQLEQSFNKQKQFVEDASHELRTPLAALQGNLSMLNRWGKDNPAILEKSLHSSLNEVDRLINLVKDLLELSRLDSHISEKEDIEMIDPSPIIDRVVEKFQTIYPDFHFDVANPELGCYLQINENHFEQLLFILIDNAVKYSAKHKKVWIKLLTTQDEIKLVVQDCGIGIPEEEIPLVLNRFYRVDKSRNRKKGGHGIGLSIAKKIVDKYHADLIINSEIDKGTSVEIKFNTDIM